MRTMTLRGEPAAATNNNDTLQEPLLLSSSSNSRISNDDESSRRRHQQQQQQEEDPLASSPPPSYEQTTTTTTTTTTPTTTTTTTPHHQPPPPPPPPFTSPEEEGEEETTIRTSSRILDRDAAFFQSRGRWRVQHVSRDAARLMHHTSHGSGAAPAPPRRRPVTKQFWDDWFYTLAYQRTIVLMLILFLTYTVIVFNFAFIYLAVSRLGQQQKINPDGSISILPFCDMDIHDYMESLYFSLSTMTTIGYGVSDYYFGGCWTPLLLVLAQVCCAITFDAVAIGLLFQRISRGHKRGKTVLFSDKAVIRCVKGIPHLMFRVGELRRHQLLEARVRVYCIRHERHLDPTTTTPVVPQDSILSSSSDAAAARVAMETVHYVTRPMKLMHGDDASSSHILMSLPQVLVHRIDASSPLMPPTPIWYDVHGHAHNNNNSNNNNSNNNNNSDHKGERAEQNPDDVQQQSPQPLLQLQELEAFLRDRDAEIVVLLEGSDELTGATIQTRHSYHAVQDLAWNQTFVPCVYPYVVDGDVEEDEEEQEESAGGTSNNSSGLRRRRRRRRGCRRRQNPSHPVCVVDFARFHDTVPAPMDCTSCPYVVE